MRPSDPPDSRDSWEPPPIEAPDATRSAKRLLVVGGGRGGVGKSLLAGSLAVYFAQLGKSVVLVDADPTGGNLHAHFGLTASSEDPDGDSHEDFARSLVPTNVPGLVLLPASHDSIAPPMALRAARKARWLARLRALNADYVVIDAGPGHGHFALDVMLGADVPICVTIPEPPAIETTYRFLRAAYRRRLRRAVMNDRYRLALVERVARSGFAACADRSGSRLREDGSNVGRARVVGSASHAYASCREPDARSPRRRARCVDERSRATSLRRSSRRSRSH
jgi:flagellar biosynthesis protein FlhG